MANLIKDLAAVTTMSEYAVTNLAETSMLCICHDVYENVCRKNSDMEMDIGIGKLHIRLDGNDIKYKFIPSDKLNALVSDTILTNKSPLTTEIEATLKDRVVKAYKELM